ncbi:hypothetical protein B0H34DRAFT_510519 [Crassisporium funariophilum]|nr:hypothetical protein B0H34DRAFT_510519 [Crassisporium funariophilum]
MTELRLSTFQRMGVGFTGVLLVAGTTFYFAKQNIAERRKADLEEYRTGEFPSFCSSLLGLSLELDPLSFLCQFCITALRSCNSLNKLFISWIDFVKFLARTLSLNKASEEKNTKPI